jgi:hypothetical protein
VARKSGEFLFVRACDKKTQEAIRSRPGEIVILDPEGAELHRGVCMDAPAIEKAMDAALQKYAPKPISWNLYESKGLESARSAGKLALLAFDDGGKDGDALLKALEDRMVAGQHERFLFVRVPFKKDSDDVRAWAVTSALTLLIVDPSQEPGPKAVLEKTVGKKTPVQLKAFLQKASKAKEKPAK